MTWTAILGIDYEADRPCVGDVLLSCGDLVTLGDQTLRVERGMDGGWILLDEQGQPRPGWWTMATIDL